MRFTNSPYEDFMKEKSYFKGVPPNLPPKGCYCNFHVYPPYFSLCFNFPNIMRTSSRTSSSPKIKSIMP